MYLGYYSIKRFFFFVIWGKFCHFFDFDAFCFVWWWNDVKLCFNKTHFFFNGTHFLKGIGGHFIKIGCGEWI